MKIATTKTSTRNGVRRIIAKLLAAIDRQIVAARDVQKARDELIRVANKEEGEQ